MTEQTKEFPSLYSITGDIKDINIALVPHQHSAQPVRPVSNDEIEAAVLAERAACAILCEARYMGDNTREDMEARRCATMIRARTK